MYGYICYFHNKININIPVYLITPALLPYLCATEIELTVGREVKKDILMDNEG